MKKIPRWVKALILAGAAGACLYFGVTREDVEKFTDIMDMLEENFVIEDGGKK